MVVTRTDGDIRADVERELAWDTRIDEKNIHVAVHEGTAVLTGSVPSYADRSKARYAALRVVGVVDVDNRLELDVSTKTPPGDNELLQAVRHTLQWDAILGHDHIEPMVASGVVTLNGRVDNLYEREEAERLVRRLEGVRDIRNELTVIEGEVDREEAGRQIAEALARLGREVEGVSVEISGSEAVLRGRVGNWSEKEAVRRAVAHAPGITGIRDEVAVG